MACTMCCSCRHSTKEHKRLATLGRLKSKKWRTHTTRAVSKALTNLWSTSKFRKKMEKKRREQCTSKEKKRLAKMAKDNWANPEFHKKMCKIRKTQSKGNQLRHPQGSFYRTMYEGVNGKFWMRSSWEVAYAKWLDHYGIRWEYESRKFILSKGHYYTPDFYLVDQKEYVELKGWMTNKDKQKIAKFKRLYPDIKLYVFFGKNQLAKVIEFGKRAA